MSIKAIFYSFGCLLAWFVLLPAMVIGGGTALLAYAIVAEVGKRMFGKSDGSLESSKARAIAHRMCLNYTANRTFQGHASR
jgi:hypothetical protein